MAKRKALVQWNGKSMTKSDAIRELLKESPRVKVREVVSRLGDKGITVNPNLVYLLKSKARGQRRKQRRARVMETTRRVGIVNPAELVLKVKALAHDAGGFTNLKQLVDALAE